MYEPKLGKGVILGRNVQFGKNVVVWNYVVIGDNTKIGGNTRIGSFCDIGRNVVIGENCVIEAHVTISNGCVIGDVVFIGPNTSLLNDKFPYSTCLTPPTIKDNVIIGGCATILPNVIIEEKSVIAAGSVVTKDVLRGTVVKGIPAKTMMSREEYETKRKNFIRTHMKT